MINFKKHLPEIIYTILFLIIAVILNIQFLDGSNINTIIAGHDEYIAVKEVYSILKPVSSKHFIMAIISGNALYYGRIVFYFDALIAYVPFLLFGIKGMVMAIRMTHALLLLISLIILANTFIKSNLSKIVFFIGSFCLYYSLYFVMMPKPEPLQLLFLAIFFNKSVKKEWQFGSHFIYLGIAYGIKFNVLLMFPILYAVPFLKDGVITFKNKWLPFLKAIIYTIIGIVVAVPCLILSPIKPIFLKTYLSETFGGTVKSYDDSEIGWIDWMNQGLGGSYLGISYLAYPFLLMVLVALFYQAYQYRKGKEKPEALILILTGAVLIIIIMLKTKRLWPHYLWTGYIFVLLGLLSDSIKNRFTQTILYSTIVFVLISFGYFSTRELPLYLNLEKAASVQENHRWSSQAIEYIKSKHKGARVGTDASMLYPFQDFVEVDTYHPFSGKISDPAETRFYWYNDFPDKIWEDSNSVVVFYKRLPQRLIEEKSKIYADKQNELLEIFQSNVSGKFEKDTTFGEIIIYKRK